MKQQFEGLANEEIAAHLHFLYKSGKWTNGDVTYDNLDDLVENEVEDVTPEEADRMLKDGEAK